ncbi:hypothetical protein REPUB_Repub11eG0051600 [Reevesia pubescens]
MSVVFVGITETPGNMSSWEWVFSLAAWAETRAWCVPFLTSIVIVEGFWSSDLATPVQTNHAVEHCPSWTPPYVEIVKINVDASFCHHNMIAKLGIMARDAVENIWFLALVRKMNIPSAFLGEVLAILIGLELARD